MEEIKVPPDFVMQLNELIRLFLTKDFTIVDYILIMHILKPIASPII